MSVESVGAPGAERLLAVGICDDEESARCRVRQLVEELSEVLGAPVRTLEFPSAFSLLECSEELDILFLDIQMPHGNGIEAAAKLRASNRVQDIVLVSAFEEYAMEGYAVEARRYLLKPLSRQRFFRQVLPIFREHIARPREAMTLVSDGEVHVVSPGDIVYLCTQPPKHIGVHTLQRIITVRDSLKRWEETLPAALFFRCHSAFLVNLKYIRVVERGSVALINGEQLPLSRHRRRALIEALAQFAGEYL